mmetsp:Transcript_107256/g.311544  ORF Transcript_107256/g.311544 Transcript_107256/m.311544 type:complete len:233 (-) Transcript_107256:290-988(-)
MTGTLPTEIGKMEYVGYNGDYTMLYSNSLTGQLPTEMGQMTALSRYLQWYQNSFTGTLPTQIGQMTQFTQSFLLYSNSIGGSLPTQLGQMTVMTQYFDLYSNAITGTLPPELANMGSSIDDLEYFRVYSNSISGTIPTEFGDANFGQYAQFYSNKITGSVSCHAKVTISTGPATLPRGVTRTRWITRRSIELRARPTHLRCARRPKSVFTFRLPHCCTWHCAGSDGAREDAK